MLEMGTADKLLPVCSIIICTPLVDVLTIRFNRELGKTRHPIRNWSASLSISC